ncbi:MAG: hypothetical protein PHQ41_08795, partial [Candidatus Cloacimonetes bacterium]|nr:hypothetical protein [Candidatus Cloacimonadota bacterium]
LGGCGTGIDGKNKLGHLSSCPVIFYFLHALPAPPFCQSFPWGLPLSLRDKYGINTDEIRIDPVFIP